MDHPRPPQDRPDRLPLADRQVHRPDAEILYVPAGQVLDVAERQDAISFDAPSARYTHRDGKCTFEVLIEDYHLDRDPALIRLAKIVHAADIAEGAGQPRSGRPVSRGLQRRP